MLTRRSLFGAIAAPAIVQYRNIMPIQALQPWHFGENQVLWQLYPSFRADAIRTFLGGVPCYIGKWPPCPTPITAASSGSPDQPRWA